MKLSHEFFEISETGECKNWVLANLWVLSYQPKKYKPSGDRTGRISIFSTSVRTSVTSVRQRFHRSGLISCRQGAAARFPDVRKWVEAECFEHLILQWITLHHYAAMCGWAERWIQNCYIYVTHQATTRRYDIDNMYQYFMQSNILRRLCFASGYFWLLGTASSYSSMCLWFSMIIA